MSLRNIIVDSQGRCTVNVLEQEWALALGDPDKFVWVDFPDDYPDADRILSTVFKFHPLAVEDTLHQIHVPRVDDWNDYLYLIVLSMTCNASTLSIDATELDLFLAGNYLVSCHRGEVAALERVWAAYSQRRRLQKRGPDHLLYQLLDEVVSDYLDSVDMLDDAIDGVENEVFGDPTTQTLNRIFRLKHAMLDMRRILTPMREVLNRLARDDYDQIDLADRVYYRDVYDHLVRMVDINETLRDLVSGTMDTYLSVVSNRLNEIMKTLTVVTVLFMPVTAITGALGMNFFFSSPKFQIPGGPLGWYGLGATLLGCACTIGALLVWMARRGWVGKWSGVTPPRSLRSQSRLKRQARHAREKRLD